MRIRPSIPDDMQSVRSFDCIAAHDDRRLAFIQRAIAANQCWSILLDDDVVGYFIIDNTFFQRTFLSLIYIAEGHRDKGLGREALRWVIDEIDGPFFVSTNLSNSRTLHLLRSLGFQDSGIIYNLDPGDPEVVFYYACG